MLDEVITEDAVAIALLEAERWDREEGDGYETLYVVSRKVRQSGRVAFDCARDTC
jgi:hypothetical protein